MEISSQKPGISPNPKMMSIKKKKRLDITCENNTPASIYGR